jgi:hypothetical protein
MCEILILTLGCLGPNELRRVQDTIWEARMQWYNLGLGLDITPDSLDSIELANAQNSDRCFRAMLSKWLREHQRPTWSALAEALTSPAVGLSHLAEEIHELVQHQPTSSASEKEKLVSTIGMLPHHLHTHTCTVSWDVLVELLGRRDLEKYFLCSLVAPHFGLSTLNTYRLHDITH